MTIAEVLASYIKNGTINHKTNEPFKLEDIKDANVKTQVEQLISA